MLTVPCKLIRRLELKSTPFAIQETGYAGFHLVRDSSMVRTTGSDASPLILAHRHLLQDEARAAQVSHRVRSRSAHERRRPSVPTEGESCAQVPLHIPRPRSGFTAEDSGGRRGKRTGLIRSLKAVVFANTPERILFFCIELKKQIRSL